MAEAHNRIAIVNSAFVNFKNFLCPFCIGKAFPVLNIVLHRYKNFVTFCFKNFNRTVNICNFVIVKKRRCKVNLHIKIS